MADEHPASFGDEQQQSKKGEDLQQSNEMNAHERREQHHRDEYHEHQPGTTPADLLPYLEEADAPDELALTDIAGTDATGVGGMNADPEAEHVAALRALVESSLLFGPDPSILAGIEGEVDEGFLEDAAQAKAEQAKPEHERALDEADVQLALDTRVGEIYRSIVSRAPEHNVQPSIQRVKAALDTLDDPQSSYSAIHITGTNGKISTVRIIDALLTAFGMKTGRFTSLHLLDTRERISLEGAPISKGGFIAAWEDVAPHIDMVNERSTTEGGPRLSFFEVFTVMAFAAFVDYPTDAAVVEVEMGGPWDATNTPDAGVSVIMPIDRDHTTRLGFKIADIACEKAGITKLGQIVVIAEQPEEALDILLEHAHEVDTVMRLEGRDFGVLGRQMGVGGQLMSVRTPAAVYEDALLPLFGEHQAHNAAYTLVGVGAFMGGRELDGRVMENGMMAATSPGRPQVVRHSPTIIADSAHNPVGVRSLARALEESFPLVYIVGVYSTMMDKEIETVLPEMEPHLDSIVMTQMPGGRAADLEALQFIAAEIFGEERVQARDSLVDAVDLAAQLAEATSDPTDKVGVVIFGSAVLADHVLSLAGKKA